MLKSSLPLIIAPSILSADFRHLEQDIQAVDEAGADWIHIDVMDGRFVPNISMGIPALTAARKSTKKPLDVHLMVVEPEKWVEPFAQAGADIITIHVEACVHLQRALAHIRSLGKKAAVALNPSTSEDSLRYVLNDLDLVLVMTVNPGFSNQSFIKSPVEKIARIRKMLDDVGNHQCHIQVDGGINPQTAALTAKAGANVFVAGGGIFGQKDYKAAIESIRQAALKKS